MDTIKDFFTAILYQPLFNALIFLAWLIPGHSIGWAIIALTIIVRLILLPSSLKTLEHQNRLRALQPKLDELKEKHGHDRTAHSKAMMELYAAEKVSPLGGCLPMLIQLPILFVLYRVFIEGLSTDQYNLLYSFTPRPETINTHWFGLDLSKPELWVLPILAGLLQYVQARQMMPLSAATLKGSKAPEADMSQAISRQMMYLMPVMTVFITRSLPAALGLYWVATTLFMIGQQFYASRLPLPDVKNGIKAKDGVTVKIRTKGPTGESNDKA